MPVHQDRPRKTLLPQLSAERVSPTAHYTGFVWARNGLSSAEFSTGTGKVLYRALYPANRFATLVGLPNIEDMLLARHGVIDALLDEAISEGRVGQVIEIAAGLSARGSRFTSRYPELGYIETDLPGMARRKRNLLASTGYGNLKHRVADIDVTEDSGPNSLAELAGELDHDTGLAIITEGLLNYFPTAEVTGMWRRFASILSEFPSGVYLSDLHVSASNNNGAASAFLPVLSAFVRGRVHLHFPDADAVSAELRAAGFTETSVRTPAEREGRGGPSARLSHIIEAGS